MRFLHTYSHPPAPVPKKDLNLLMLVSFGFTNGPLPAYSMPLMKNSMAGTFIVRRQELFKLLYGVDYEYMDLHFAAITFVDV